MSKQIPTFVLLNRNDNMELTKNKTAAFNEGEIAAMQSKAGKKPSICIYKQKSQDHRDWILGFVAMQDKLKNQY